MCACKRPVLLTSVPALVNTYLTRNVCAGAPRIAAPVAAEEDEDTRALRELEASMAM